MKISCWDVINRYNITCLYFYTQNIDICMKSFLHVLIQAMTLLNNVTIYVDMQ